MEDFVEVQIALHICFLALHNTIGCTATPRLCFRLSDAALSSAIGSVGISATWGIFTRRAGKL